MTACIPAAASRILALGLVTCLIAPSWASAQSILADGGFDGAPQTQYGNRFDEDLSPWMFATVSPTAVIQNTQNLVAVDGPGGFDYLDLGPESDASGAPAGVTQYYIDSGNIPLYGWQYFTPSCRGTATASMKVTNREGHGETGPTRTGSEVPPQTDPFTFRSTQGGLAVLQVSNEIPAFPVGFGVAPATTAQLVTALKTQFDAEKMPFLLTAGSTQTYPWTPMTVQVPVEAGQLYAFMAELGHSVNMDEASVELDCDDPVVPIPTDISIEKTCTPPVLGQHNGVDGLFWNCVIDVQGSGPMPPNVHIIENPDTDGGTTVQTLSMTSIGGSADCAWGGVQQCFFLGANFDPTTGEQFAVQLFLSGGVAPNVYNAENCVFASYNQNGVQNLQESCVQTQWSLVQPSPTVNAFKTCDPIAPVSSGPMTLNCQIEVTGTNLVPGSFVIAGDGFAGLAPVTASIAGTMMNITSNEPWSCVDLNINTPSSLGLCELAAADMAAAGGTSVINVSFEFTTDQTDGQVVNCPMSDTSPTSFIGAAGQRNAEPPMRSPQTNSQQGLPDGCVILDLPGTTPTPKIERAEMNKSCDQPVQAVVNSVLGYTWDCEASITVTPTPFSGTFTFDDDASNISIGSAQFLSASEPNCQGIGTDQLSCTLDGTVMTAPHLVTYQLFTALTDPNQPIEWENCIKGRAETVTDEYPTVPMCVGRVIKPEISIDDPEPNEMALSKFCGTPRDGQHDGVNGKLWSCEITVAATPAPFSGSFSFLEDASSISGTTSANIIGYQSGNAAWTCGGTFPQPQTQCGIIGSAFSPSGVETISFELFAADQGNSVKWENCVSGSYTNTSGEARAVEGNCVSVDWDTPKEPPVIPLEKNCRVTGTENGNTHYLCSIHVNPPVSGTVTGPLTVDELFTTASGAPATQYIQSLTGTPAAPNGWVCQQPAFPSGASCTISAADFNSNTGHRIDAYIAIPNGVLQKEEFRNCAQVRIGDQVVGSADCVDITGEIDEVRFDVEKSCKPSGERHILGDTGWVQAYQCTLTVTTNGVPFTDPLWITEDLHFGTNSGAGQIQSITSADPWSCSNPPYSAPGQGNVPYCGIQGAQFPASGTSTLTVDLMMNAAMDQFGAENCVSLSVGQPTPNGLPAPIASDCYEIAPVPTPEDPDIDLVKTCSPAQQTTAGQWTVACTLTITGQNLPAGVQVRVTDELMSSATQTAIYGQVMGATNACGGGQMNGGTSSACDITTDDIISAPGGVLTIPFTGTYQGPAGRPLNGAQARNCAYVDIAALGLHGPVGGNGKSCVPVTFPLSSVGGAGPMIGDVTTPSTPTPGTGGFEVGSVTDTIATPVIPVGCGFDTLFLIDRSGSMNLHNRLPLTKQALIAALRVFEGGGSRSGAIIFNQSANVIGGPSAVLPSPDLEAAIGGFSAWGNEDWQVGMSATNTTVSGMTNKPLVLFISDGVPGKPFPGDYAQNINAALPALNALRNQGSRVVGVALGYTSVATSLSTLLGPDLVTAGGNAAFDPLTTDVIHIPDSSQIIPAFEAIARAYCPERVGMTEAQTEALIEVMQAMPKSESAYLGDDEDHVTLEQDEVVQPPVLPVQSPVLTILKEQTGPCEANRASQTYSCGFRLSVTNTGTGPYFGPLVVTDTAGNPGLRSATAIAGGDWTCGTVVRDAISCTNAAVNLAPGASTHVDLRMNVQGLRAGGSIRNCGTTGVTADHRQRVALIQKIMNDRGLEAGPVDGVAGNKTYAALSTLRSDLGLPGSREFDNALFNALGLPLQTAGQASCVTVDLAPMPAPPLQCNTSTTVAQGESCACRYDNMTRRNATSCQCLPGFSLVAGAGCQEVVAPTPQPVPETGPDCDRRSTYPDGNACSCIDHENARNVSETQCRCTNGLPMINGNCIPIRVNPTIETDGPAEPTECRIRINGICLN
ncbi:hypothetical protein [Thalassobius sp. I31.1]|uniref:hypothetical protein n=1 Tax=Thalassobius sp. I31.1 TaxID=2109912 RepID=UPI0013008944|nr:hypothetical protein [Thalassobius sp. I31.1]